MDGGDCLSYIALVGIGDVVEMDIVVSLFLGAGFVELVIVVVLF